MEKQLVVSKKSVIPFEAYEAEIVEKVIILAIDVIKILNGEVKTKAAITVIKQLKDAINY